MLLKDNYPSIVSLHYVSDDAGLDDLKPWVISYHTYCRLLDYLEDCQYKTLGFEDLKSEQDVNKSIIITFDDCAKHLWDFAIPELKRRNMKAVFYMPTACLGGYNEWNVSEGRSKVELMDEYDIKKLVEIGMEVGSHSHQHIMLSEQPFEVVVEELTKSKSILEGLVRKPVISVAYPYGDVPQNHNDIAQNIGYTFGLSVITRFESRYSFRRWIYEDTDDIDAIKWKMSLGYKYYRVFDDNRNIIAKKVLAKGYKMYAKLKHGISAYIAFVAIYTNDLVCL